MITIRNLCLSGVALALTLPAPAYADEDFEVWLNPSIGTELDDNTAVEVEGALRFRSSAAGRDDTYFVRGWIKQKIAPGFTLSGGAERRHNSDGSDETRFLQQLTTSHGVLKTRVRLEQRFVDNRGGRMGLRLRPRLGLESPITEDERLTIGADAELFWTLRGTSVGGDTGLTGLRTQVGFGYEVSDNLDLSLVYLRQQDFEDNARDTIGHAPLLTIDFSF